MFRLGLSFDEKDFKKLSKVSDRIIVHANNQSNSIKCIYALESDIPDKVLVNIKNQLISICDNSSNISRYSHINQIFDTSLIPLIAYIETINRLNKIHEGNIELILPVNFYFHSKELRIFLAEGEKRFSFMYNRNETFSFFIKEYCKANKIQYSFIKKFSYSIPFSGYLRKKIIFFGKFIEDLKISFNREFNKKNFLADKKTLILHRASPSKLNILKEYNKESSCTILIESSALPTRSLIKACNDRDLIFRMPHPGVFSVIKSYLKHYKKTSYDYDIDVYGMKISLRGILKELEIMNPNLEIYKNRLRLLKLKNISEVFSTQLKSPYAAVEHLYFSNINKPIYFNQIVDSQIRPTPKFIFGGTFIPFSKSVGRLVIKKNDEINIKDPKKTFKNLKELDYKKNGPIIFFNTEMSKLHSSKLIEKRLLRFAENKKTNLKIYKHPRDKSVEQEISNMRIEDKIKEARLIFTYPSAAIFELIKYNIPLIILFIGVGRDYKWHYSYNHNYEGCMHNIDEIESINLDTIKNSYNNYRKELED